MIADHVFATAAKYPDNIALSCNGRQITYRELNDRALRLAALIRSYGLVKNNIGIATQKTVAAYVGVLGVLYAGCSYVPLNPKHPARRLASIIRNAAISAIIYDESENICLEELLNSGGTIKHVIRPENDIANVSPLHGPVPVGPGDLAYVMFTSGSTGEPKGVMVTHANVCSHIANMTEMYKFTAEDRFSQTFDLSFDPSVSDMFCAWFNGGRLCALAADDLFCPSEYIQREGLTFWASVPTLGNFMSKLGKLKPGAFPSLKHSTFCGEPFPQALAHQWRLAAPNSTIENLYGPTEATVYVTRHVYEKHEHANKYSNNIVPIGSPLPGQFAVIVDERRQMVPDGEIGELCVTGSQVTLGYLNDETKTAAVFVSMPWDSRRWYRTGDLALVNKNGHIECLGRIDAQVKIGGQRVELGEIESVLREVAATPDVAVVPAAYESGVPQKLAAFIAKQLTETEKKKISEACQQALQAVFVPKAIYSLDTLPLNPSGKIDRQALKRLAETNEAAR
ncbi:MAG: amino acid adenylation domain-containing protein [Candidatus Margulisbacteria bacterium]|jgi:amino acid adenylation domain-containing protein|nr:amino acid adenylation domain-containing protein [Candidatus Margulisiibacteriota bacterium]